MNQKGEQTRSGKEWNEDLELTTAHTAAACSGGGVIRQVRRRIGRYRNQEATSSMPTHKLGTMHIMHYAYAFFSCEL